MACTLVKLNLFKPYQIDPKAPRLALVDSKDISAIDIANFQIWLKTS